MSTLLSSLKFGNKNEYNRPKFSASTERKLESLGIDPTLMTSESQAISLISARQTEKGFRSFNQNQEIPPKYKDFTTTGLYSTISIQADNKKSVRGF